MRDPTPKIGRVHELQSPRLSISVVVNRRSDGRSETASLLSATSLLETRSPQDERWQTRSSSPSRQTSESSPHAGQRMYGQSHPPPISRQFTRRTSAALRLRGASPKYAPIVIRLRSARTSSRMRDAA